jgi:T-complex protein 1 subunit gamma
MLTIAEPLLDRNIHPTRIVKGFFTALEDAIKIMDQKLVTIVDLNNLDQVNSIVKSCIGTKSTVRHGELMCKLAVDAIKTVTTTNSSGEEQIKSRDIDIKRFVRIEKIPGGSFDDSKIIKGVVLNKDVLHPKMRRRIENPRILLLDCPLEYKKGESMTNVSLEREEDFEMLLKLEDEYIKQLCEDIAKFKPDLVITEKGLSDLAQYYFVKNNITALRRAKKTDNDRIARATGATIVNRTSEIKESDIGTGAGLFEVRKIGDDYFAFIEDCKSPKACTILLRGPSKDLLNELERNLQDALHVVKNIFVDPRIVPGGGAIEMALSQELSEKSKSIKGLEQLPYEAVARALEVIPRTLAQNCGAKVIRVITELRAKHAAADNEEKVFFGIDGEKGVITDMRSLNIWEPYAVKAQTLKTAIESACLIVRIDDVLSGISKGQQQGGGGGGEAPEPEE